MTYSKKLSVIAPPKPKVDMSHLIKGEDPEEYRKFAEEIIESYRPADYMEKLEIERAIFYGWRIQRCRRVVKLLEGKDPKALASWQKLTADAERWYKRVRKQLDRKKAARAKELKEQLRAAQVGSFVN